MEDSHNQHLMRITHSTYSTELNTKLSKSDTRGISLPRLFARMHAPILIWPCLVRHEHLQLIPNAHYALYFILHSRKRSSNSRILEAPFIGTRGNKAVGEGAHARSELTMFG